MPAFVDFRVELIEQPLPADADDALTRSERRIPLCADEFLSVRLPISTGSTGNMRP